MNITKESALRPAAKRPAAKFDQACAQLSQMAYNLGPDAKLPTFATLCEYTRVSKATLDAALGQLEAQGIIMRRQGAGIFVSSQLKRSIALVCDPRFSVDPRLRGFWGLIVREAQLRVAGTHYDLAFHFSTIETDSETKGPALHPALMNDIESRRVQGILTVGVPDETVEWINQQGTTVVAFGGKGPAAVNMDVADMVALGVKNLAERGCHRIAVWSEALSAMGTNEREDERARTRAFRRIFTAQGLEFQNHWLRPQTHAQAHETLMPNSFDHARQWVQEVFGEPRESWPDGLLITNDIMTRDVMPALQKLNIVPKRDIIIASHGNTDSPVLRAYEDDLTVVEYDSGEIVYTMFELLETLMRGETLTQSHVMIKPKIRMER